LSSRNRDPEEKEHPHGTKAAPESLLKREETPSAAADKAREQLAEQLAKLQTERDELFQTLVRRQADFENFRKRIERESLEAGQRGATRVIEELLPVLDAFEHAIAAHDDPAYEEYRKGFQLIYQKLWDALARQGLARIEAEGQAFDPHVHQAVERVETEDYDDGTVLAVLQPGYMLRGRVLRPAIVRVAVHPGEKSSEAEQQVN